VNLSTEIIFGECLLYGFLERLSIQDWQLREKKKKKDALMNYQSKSFKKSIQDWMDSGVKNGEKNVWATEQTAYW
jgi:hypothetical protein